MSVRKPRSSASPPFDGFALFSDLLRCQWSAAWTGTACKADALDAETREKLRRGQGFQGVRAGVRPGRDGPLKRKRVPEERNKGSEERCGRRAGLQAGQEGGSSCVMNSSSSRRAWSGASS
jgi:hypothetical protein